MPNISLPETHMDVEQGNLSYDGNKDDDPTKQTSSSSPHAGSHSKLASTTSIVAALVVAAVGACAAALVLGTGVPAARRDAETTFSAFAGDVVQQLERVWSDYQDAGLWVQQSSLPLGLDLNHEDKEDDSVLSPNATISAAETNAILRRIAEQRRRLEQIHAYLQSTDDHDAHSHGHDTYDNSYDHYGLDYSWIGLAPYVPHAERALYETEGAEYFNSVVPPGFSFSYDGFRVVEGMALVPQSENPFYYPLHYVQPSSSFGFFDLDFYSRSFLLKPVIDQALASSRPVLSRRIFTNPTSQKYAVILIHPGAKLTTLPTTTTTTVNNSNSTTEHDNHGNLPTLEQEERPRDVAVVAVLIDALLGNVGRLLNGRRIPYSVFLFDSTASETEDEGDDYDPPYLGGVRFDCDGPCDPVAIGAEAEGETGKVQFFPPMPLAEVRALDRSYKYEHTWTIASRRWTVIVLADPGEYKPDLTFLILGSVMIFVACLLLSLWLWTNHRRQARYYQLMQAAETEKAALLVRHAQETARRERELNDFIAHEVRNPLSAALSASSFVTAEVQSPRPLETLASQTSVKEDMDIVNSSLHFINDLLRNMLDMHRANSNQLQLELKHTDMKRDILDPVAAMLYSRGADFEVIVECEPDVLVFMADKLRLKQIILNLGRNSCKFVEKGFVRLRAVTDHGTDSDEEEGIGGNVTIYIEDSGPGIPHEKRGKLFNKFQESLDTLHQGTGIGLAVCRRLIDLMGGDIVLDESYDSGIPGYPGARFVVHLNHTAVSFDEHSMSSENDKVVESTSEPNTEPQHADEKSQTPHALLPLPENLSVLFVDDDLLLRRLFRRSVQKIMPHWHVDEASSGEAALSKAAERHYDIIFMDQYMSSVSKQLLGTETVRALRSNGVTQARICGLSANDMESQFLRAGANAFLIKPFPCGTGPLTKELMRIYSSDTFEVAQ
eukprot:scaffold482_cov266-Amphora_coffeaeformis.AAC.38